MALAFPDLSTTEQDVAVPLRLLGEHWIAYYWPFVDPAAPILLGIRATRGNELRHDLAFRPAGAEAFAAQLAGQVVHFIDEIAQARNVARF